MLSEGTLNQLRIGCKLGMLDSWGQQMYKPDFKSTFEDEKENLDYVIVNRHQFNSINARYLHFKRDEIRKGIIKDAIPFSTRLGTICGEEVFVIQQVGHDYISAKMVGTPEQINIIKGSIRDNMTFEGMTDDEFWEAHRRDLGAYRNIPEVNGLSTLHIERSRFTKGAYNLAPEKLDIQGLHVTQIDDYDNYKYVIEETSRDMYYKIVSKQQQKERYEDTRIWYEEKLEDWQKCIGDNANRIYTILTTKTKFVEDIKIYNFKAGSKLYKEEIMTDLCKKHNVSYRGGWATWKALNIDALEYFIDNEEYMDSDVPNLFRMKHKSKIVEGKS